ncbi:MAG: M28 family peptidase [Myxococcaceae bacterium]
MLTHAAVLLLSLSSAADDKPNLDVVYKIKDEAFTRGQVMEHLFWLTDANGPRLTNSPGYKAAADWAVKTLKGWGGQNVHLEKWGHFGRGWSVSRFSASLQSPAYAPLHGSPKAWCSGTSGPVSAELVVAPVWTREEPYNRWDLEKISARLDAYFAAEHGKLNGKMVMVNEERDLELPKDSVGSRFDDPKLTKEAIAPEPYPVPKWEWPLKNLPLDDKRRQALLAAAPLEVLAEYGDRVRAQSARLADFFRTEGAVAVFSTDDRGEGGVVFAESNNNWEGGKPAGPPWVVLQPEDYNRVMRLIDHKVPVKAQVDLQATFDDANQDGYDVIAEIPGGKKKDELVMLGAHLDSWHAGTGASDNGAGSAVVLEAFRILQALKLPMDCTVRLALWSGEEQGLLGSRGYVKEHFADPVTMKLKGEHAKLSGYFNLDYGSGKIRGVYLQGNDMARPIFDAWLMPFKDEGANTISIRSVGGTDHLSFDAVGLPGFQFIQDPLDYGTRTHHSSLDLYDHAQPSDLMQAAAIMATFVYLTANRPEPLPRKPLPKALPPKKP